MPKNLNNKFLEKLNVNGRDLAVFLLSLLLAFSIWISHNLSLQYSSLISVPVIAQSNIEGRASESSNTVAVVARCRTTGYRLLSKNRSARRRTLKVLFSPDDLHYESEDVFNITSNELGGYVNEIFGDNVQLESFISSKLQFKFAEESNKKVPVQAMSIVSFKPQYMATETMSLSPDSVIVYGEPLTLQNIDRVFTETIKLESLAHVAHGVAKLEPPKGNVRLSEQEVSYSLDVSRFVEISKDVVVGVRNVPAGKDLSVYPSEARVVFKCAFPMTVDPTDNVTLYVDYNDFASSINGRCVPHASGLNDAILDYSVDPQVFECIENLRK
ncbi:MAG: hypothetical protein Q4G10_01390 [Bacteroidia bacterium]|nr:hypothetical protein [Bacteroidia bacterium]